MQASCIAPRALPLRPGGQPHLFGASSSGSSRAPLGPPQLQRDSQGRGLAQLVAQAARREQQAGLNRMEAAVPREQRPVNELQQLKDTPLLAWVRSASRGQQPRLLRPHGAPPLRGPASSRPHLDCTRSRCRHRLLPAPSSAACFSCVPAHGTGVAARRTAR